VESGAADRFGLSTDEPALGGSSQRGEGARVDAVARGLARPLLMRRSSSNVAPLSPS